MCYVITYAYHHPSPTKRSADMSLSNNIMQTIFIYVYNKEKESGRILES